MQILKRLNDTIHEAPFGKYDIYHANVVSIDLDHEDWDRKVQQVRNALMYKEPRGTDKGHTTQEFNDTLLAFSNDLNSMLQQIRRKDGVFTRETFE